MKHTLCMVSCMVLAGCCAKPAARQGLILPTVTPPVSALAVIREKCVRCHSGDNPPGELDLTSLENMRKGGKRGPAVVPYHPEQSLIYQAMAATGEVPVMPPFDRAGEAETAAVKNWIYRGCQTTSMSGNAP